MSLFEDLTSEWLLGDVLAPALYECDQPHQQSYDNGLIKSQQPSSNKDVTDLLLEAEQDEGLGGLELEWLDQKLDFNLINDVPLLPNPSSSALDMVPVTGQDGNQMITSLNTIHLDDLSSVQSSAIDLLQSLMDENACDEPASAAVDSLDEVDASITLPPVEAASWDQIRPMTPEEVESILSSAPSSPDSAITSIDVSDAASTATSDSEWLPSPAPKKSRSKPYDRPTATDVSSPSSSPKVKTTRSSPYEGMSKKERKKLQNKNAAIRYRQKKRAEAETIVTEEQELEDQNTALKEKVDELTREIKQMKDILSAIYQAKGLTTETPLLRA